MTAGTSLQCCYCDSHNNRISFPPRLENSYRTLYWSLFSMTQLKDIKIQGGQVFTEIVGEMLFMAYQTMAVIVLINMLIAMMSNSFQEIEVSKLCYKPRCLCFR